MRRFSFALFMILSLSLPAAAQDVEEAEVIEHVEGVVEPLDVVFPPAPAGEEEAAEDGLAAEGRLLWSQSFLRAGSSSIQLRLDNRGTEPEATGWIEVLDSSGDLVERIDAARLAAEGTIWTDLAFGSVIELLVIGDDTSTLSFTVSAVSYEKSSSRVESIIGPDGREHIIAYDGAFAPVLKRVEGAVAKLTFIKTVDGFPKRFVCTGFLIADNLLMTNEHCVNTAELCATTKVQFGFSVNQLGIARPKEQVDCRKVEKVSFPLDYALLQLEGNPGQRWGTLAFADRAAQPGEQIFIVQHPAGEPKQISDVDCKVKGSPVNGRAQRSDLSHTCDTLGGSSGSPVLNAAGEVVGLHHLGKQSAGQFSNANRAVLSAKVVAEILP